MDEKIIKNIANTNLFNGISENDTGELLRCFKCNIKHYKNGQYIVFAGENLKEIGLIISGEISVLRENIDGSKSIMTLLKSGDTFGEVAAFNGDLTWPSSISAQSDCSILFFNPQFILNPCSSSCTFHKKLISNTIKLISNKAKILNQKVEYLSIKSIRGKISKYILSEYNKTKSLYINSSLNREELANFFNITRPSLSRELCKMRNEKIIHFNKNNFKILNLESLIQSIK